MGATANRTKRAETECADEDLPKPGAGTADLQRILQKHEEHYGRAVIHQRLARN